MPESETPQTMLPTEQALDATLRGTSEQTYEEDARDAFKLLADEILEVNRRMANGKDGKVRRKYRRVVAGRTPLPSEQALLVDPPPDKPLSIDEAFVQAEAGIHADHKEWDKRMALPPGKTIYERPRRTYYR